MKRGLYLVAGLLLLAACEGAEVPPDRSAFATESYALTACADGEMIDGIDVSKWQGSVNWAAVADAGIDFAFIRVSDGLGYQDAYFQSNWSEAKAHGIVRGTYQFFRSDEDPIAQAQYLLDEMGPLEWGDLPPVCDVETADGQDPATIVDRVQTWLDFVEEALGVKPIIYTSPGVWGSIVNSGAFADYPLWVAHWGASCPSMPTGWNDWVFWQTSDSGSISGVNGDVDTNKFNGGMAELAEFGFADEGGPPPPLPPEEQATPCRISPDGYSLIEEDSACARRLGAPVEALYTDIQGHGGHAWSTEADEISPYFSQGVEWLFKFDEAGAYKVWAHVPATSESLVSGAVFEINHASGTTMVTVDQSAHVGGAAHLGTFEFELGAEGQLVRALDSYVSDSDKGLRVAFDAIEVAPAVACACADATVVETLSCGDGGTMTRTCDGCDWSDWSECDGAVVGAVVGDDVVTRDDAVTGDDAVAGPVPTVQAYTSGSRLSKDAGGGCQGGGEPVRPAGWLLILAAVALCSGRCQRWKSVSKSPTP